MRTIAGTIIYVEISPSFFFCEEEKRAHTCFLADERRMGERSRTGSLGSIEPHTHTLGGTTWLFLLFVGVVAHWQDRVILVFSSTFPRSRSARLEVRTSGQQRLDGIPIYITIAYLFYIFSLAAQHHK
ncbi:hypothetical protein L209DRAFT_309888 [Thermothelomyces heterothallicus CBS 203.75]